MLLTSWLSRKLGFERGCRGNSVQSACYSCRLEWLEDRTVPTTLYVVPAAIPNDATHYHTVQSAFDAASTADVVQIEPNSTPGGVNQLSTSPPAGLTIQGDPAYNPSDLPQLGPLVLQNGNFSLTNLNLSSLDHNQGNAVPGSAFIFITSCTITDLNDTANHDHTELTNDTIMGSVLLTSTMNGEDQPDLVQGCLFLHLGSAPANPNGMLHLIRADGTEIINNTFTSSQLGDIAVLVDDSLQVAVVQNNITLTSGDAFDTGIFVENRINNGPSGPGSGDTSAILSYDSISTSNDFGFGIVTFKSANCNLNVKIQDNDLQQNHVGLYVVGDGAQLGNVDAGSYSGSQGDNHFESYVANTDGRVAIATSNATSGVVQALYNFWTVPNPQTVVLPEDGTTIETSSWLSFVGVDLSILLAVLGNSGDGMNKYDLTDYGNGVFNLGVGGQVQNSLIRGVHEVELRTLGGSGPNHVVVNYQMGDRLESGNPNQVPADLQVQLGNYDELRFDALPASSSSNTQARKWHVAISGAGNNVVNAAFDGIATNILPDLSFNFGGGHNTFNLTADVSRKSPGPWTINVVSGTGIIDLHSDIIGAVPVNLAATLVGGTNQATFAFHNIAQLSSPENIRINSVSGVNNISVFYDTVLPFIVGTRRSSPIVVDVNSRGTDTVNIGYDFHPTERMPATFNVPLETTFHGDGYANLNVSYKFFAAQPGSDNGIIAILAPITLKVSGTGVHSTDVNFDSGYAPLDDAHSIVEIDSPLTFDINGNNRGSLVGLMVGDSNQSDNPELMRNASLDVRLTGGSSADTISGVIALAQGNKGSVNANVFGGSGNDNLTLDVYCPEDVSVAALMVTGPGQDTVQHTNNVRVIA
jgi:hypothetical protein